MEAIDFTPIGWVWWNQKFDLDEAYLEGFYGE
jgi:hypothetical protein